MAFLGNFGGRLKKAFGGNNLMISRALLAGDYAGATQLRERQAALAAQRADAERANQAAAMRAQALAAFGYDKASIAGLAPHDASDLLRQRMLGASTMPPGAVSVGPPRVNSPEERDALPAGTPYVDPDGRIRLRR